MSKIERRDYEPSPEMDLVGVYDNESLQVAGLVADCEVIRPEVEAIAELERVTVETSQIQLISYTTT